MASQFHGLQFEFMLPPGKIWFGPKEVGSIIGRTDQFVRDAIKNRKILSHVSNARSKPGREIRNTYQIHRHALFLYLSKTANYNPKDFI